MESFDPLLRNSDILGYEQCVPIINHSIHYCFCRDSCQFLVCRCQPNRNHGKGLSRHRVEHIK